MDFYDAVKSRRTSRQWLEKDVDFEVVKRILEAGKKAPTWDHHRSWHYIVLRTAEEKERAFGFARKLADKFDAERYLNAPRPYPVTLGQKMYGYALPRQYTMLRDAPFVVVPVFRAKKPGGGSFSALNPFATIWCVVENIFLAAAAEGLSCSMRIPLEDEHEEVKRILKVPPTYRLPVFIGIGHPDPEEPALEQYEADMEKQLHFGSWK